MKHASKQAYYYQSDNTDSETNSEAATEKGLWPSAQDCIKPGPTFQSCPTVMKPMS